MSRIVDKTGNKYGRLTVVRQVGKNKHGRVLWECKCSCGNTVIVDSSHLNPSGNKSCGCLRTENIRKAVCLPKGRAAFNSLYSDYVRDAKKRKLEFAFTKSQFEDLVTSNCHYCGAEPAREYARSWANGSFFYNGIDRKDNDVGYLLDNCVASCWECNYLKRGIDYEAFLSRIRAIAKHLSRRNTLFAPRELGCNETLL
jgi:hypothetical protein